MISTLVMRRAVWFRGTPLLPINVCSHCGDCDDPEGYWAEDEDGDRICFLCEQGLEGKLALVPYDRRFHKFDWTTVADAAQQAFTNALNKLVSKRIAQINQMNADLKEIRNWIAA